MQAYARIMHLFMQHNNVEYDIIRYALTTIYT